jgi:hypothetical protein
MPLSSHHANTHTHTQKDKLIAVYPHPFPSGKCVHLIYGKDKEGYATVYDK